MEAESTEEPMEESALIEDSDSEGGASDVSDVKSTVGLVYKAVSRVKKKNPKFKIKRLQRGRLEPLSQAQPIPSLLHNPCDILCSDSSGGPGSPESYVVAAVSPSTSFLNEE